MSVVVPEASEDHGCWTDEYWLCHCQSFRVDSPEGRIGFVEEVLLSPAGEAEALAVRLCLPGQRLVVVPVEEVCEVRPNAERVVLRSASCLREEAPAGV